MSPSEDIPPKRFTPDGTPVGSGGIELNRQLRSGERTYTPGSGRKNLAHDIIVESEGDDKDDEDIRTLQDLQALIPSVTKLMDKKCEDKKAIRELKQKLATKEMEIEDMKVEMNKGKEALEYYENKIYSVHALVQKFNQTYFDETHDLFSDEENEEKDLNRREEESEE